MTRLIQLEVSPEAAELEIVKRAPIPKEGSNMTTEEIKYLDSRFDRIERQNEMILIYLGSMTTREQYEKIKKALDKLANRKFHRALDIEKLKEMFKH